MRKNNKNRKRLKGIKGVYNTYIVEGYNIDTLINKLHKKNIDIFNLKKLNQKKIKLTIKCCDNEKFIAISKNLWYTKKVKESGFSYPFLFLIRNIGIAIGILIFIVSAYVANDRVFLIEFNGTGSVLSQDVTNYLQSTGITTMSKFSSINLKELSNQILKNNNKLSFVSCSKNGNRLCIDLALAKNNIETLKGDAYSLVSNIDGVVEEIKVYSGTALIKVGDNVKKGDLLVDGYVIIKDNIIPERVIATVSILSTFSYTYSSINDNDEITAELLAREELNKEITSVKVEKQIVGEEYIYNTFLTYKTVIYAG